MGIQVERISTSIKLSGGRWQTLFEVKHVYSKGHARTLDVLVLGWDPDRTFNISARFLPEELKSTIRRGDAFLATVNLGARKAKGLKPTKFKALPSKMEMLPYIVDLL